jgi:hypothetical protein
MPYRVLATKAGNAWASQATPSHQRTAKGGRRHRRVSAQGIRATSPPRRGGTQEEAFRPTGTEETKEGTESQDGEDVFYDARQTAEATAQEARAYALPVAPRARGNEQGYFDSDSFLIAVDNCCSKCITNSMSDFIEPPERVNIRVRGIGGNVTATLIGTVQWSIEDDNGKIHTWTIKGTYYNAASPYRLFSPQHRAQIVDDNYPKRRGTWCGTYDDAVELWWDQRKYKGTIELNPTTNIALVRSAPGGSLFHAFCHEIMEIETTPLSEEEFYCMTVEVSDDEATSDGDPDRTDAETYDRIDADGRLPDEAGYERRHPDIPDKVFTISEDDPAGPTTIPEDEDVQYGTPQAEALAWHYRLGHVLFAKIKQMAARGDLPAYLGRVKPPKCAACMFGKATRRAWRSRSPANKLSTPPATSPGAVVAIDQMISSTPGLIAQISGFITKKRYKVTTVFVDHFSGLSFVYLQKSTSGAETVEAKCAFERYACAHGVTVRHYHADNGIFAEAEFIKAVEAGQQSISYCAVNAHHQNGKAEKKIRDLQELARAQLLHAKQRWPSAVTTALWPYAVRLANEVSNFSPGIQSGVSPIEKFTQVAVAPRVKHSHTFGSPVYVLKSSLQAGQSVPKWEERARIGVFLGFSPRHSRKVALASTQSNDRTRLSAVSLRLRRPFRDAPPVGRKQAATVAMAGANGIQDRGTRWS